MRDEDFFELENDSEAPVVSEPVASRGKMKQQMKRKQKGATWKAIWFKQAALAIAGGMGLILLSHFLLLQVTRHGNAFPVPDFTGMTIEEATALAEEKHLRLDVTDSVYVHQLPRGAVFKQNPQPAVFAKKNRRVLLTINSLAPRNVTVPNVVGFSLRQAKTVLNTQGLEVGTLTYVPDIATHNVLEQCYKGNLIGPHVKLPAESLIDLTLGVNDPAIRTAIPQLAGLTLEQARDLMTEYSLNLGRIQFDKAVKTYSDSLSAKVYRQIPSAAPQSEHWNLGARVDIYLTLDEGKLPKE